MPHEQMIDAFSAVIQNSLSLYEEQTPIYYYLNYLRFLGSDCTRHPLLGVRILYHQAEKTIPFYRPDSVFMAGI